MPALRDVQRALAAAILRRDGTPPDRWRARRLAVYRVNARENFAAALEGAFPVLREMLGAEEFRSLAWSFQQRHPSRSGDLFEVGRPLPAFLAAHLAGTDQGWQADLAHLEWAVQEALVAAEPASPFDPARLAGLAPDAQAQLRFTLHPSVRRITTDWDVLATWQAHGDGARPVPAVTRGATTVLVYRAADGIRAGRLAAAPAAILAGVQSGASLGDIAGRLGADGETGEAAALGDILAAWVASGVVTGVAAGPAGDAR